MAIVAAEAPESSSHTGRQGALVVQPQNDAACPAWFSGFMQMNQSANQNVDDKLTIMAGKQDTTLAAVQGMQVSITVSSSSASTHVAVLGAPGQACQSLLLSGCTQFLFCCFVLRSVCLCWTCMLALNGTSSASWSNVIALSCQ